MSNFTKYFMSLTEQGFCEQFRIEMTRRGLNATSSYFQYMRIEKKCAEYLYESNVRNLTQVNLADVISSVCLFEHARVMTVAL